LKGDRLVVYVLMQAKVGRERRIVEKAKRFPGVTEAKPVYGEYDVVVRIELNDLSVLDQAVTQIRRIPDVVRTTTLISML